MSVGRRAALALLATAVGALTACGGNDDDGGAPASTTSTPASDTTVPVGPAMPDVIVDTDLGADDLVALTVLLGSSQTNVVAIVVDGNGLVHCDPGVTIAARVVAAAGHAPIPIGCGPDVPGASGRLFPDDWRANADAASGVGDLLPDVEAPPARTAADVFDTALADADLPVSVVALGPLTNVAAAISRAPADEILRVIAMGGLRHGSSVDAGVAEWNAAVDPQAFDAVLAARVSMLLVPADAVPLGPPPLPESCASPLCELARAVVDVNQLPAWWDAIAAAMTIDVSGALVERGPFTVTPDGPDAGRLVPAASGHAIDLVTEIDPAAQAPNFATALA